MPEIQGISQKTFHSKDKRHFCNVLADWPLPYEIMPVTPSAGTAK